MLRKHVGKHVESAIGGIALSLNRTGITPNMLTFTGLAINGLAAYFYYRGLFIWGGMVILFAGLFDMLDGAVARAGNNVSKIGGFFDSVTDRYSDFLIFGGVLAHFAGNSEFGMTLLVLVILCGAFMVSYVRARAELVIPKCDVGLLERPERIVILAAGSIFGFPEVALWFLAVFTHLTAGYRIYYTHKNARKSAR
jgi:phosphatidylglycerophosphate synthase